MSNIEVMTSVLLIALIIIVIYLVWRKWFRTDYNQMLQPRGKNDDEGPVGSGVPLRFPPDTGDAKVEKTVETDTLTIYR